MRLLTAFAFAAAALASSDAHAAASGYALTPERTSVEAGTTQTFSARFLDAAGRPAAGETVQFSNDACGTYPNGGFVMNTVTDAAGVASAAFTAMQPGGTVCAMMAANAGAQVRYQVFTYRLSQVSLAVTAPEHPLRGASFALPVQVRMGSYALPNVDVAARIVAGTGGATVESSVNTGSSGSAGFTVTPAGNGDFDVEVSLRSLVKRVAIHYEASAPPAPFAHQDLWWAGTGENGWGLSIIEHRDVLFVLVYAYDAAGRPTWYVISNGTWNGNAYTGLLYAPRGTPYYAYDASRWAPGSAVGSATFTFTDADHASLDYIIEGVPGHKSIARLVFGPPGAAPLAGVTDMWWGGVAQNGWGLAVVQQNASLFVMWFTYDALGLPVWFTMPSGAWTAADTYEGRVYRATGSPWLGRPYDGTLFKPLDVGSYRLRFSGDTATFEYNVEGRAGALALTRTPF